MVYFPLGVGGPRRPPAVREVGVALLELGRRWVMPGPEYAGIVTYYEDFPYAWWNDFRRLEELPAGALAGCPADVGARRPSTPTSRETVERKVQGLGLYESQIERLFGGKDQMGDAVRGFGTKVASLGGLPGFAERYWASSKLYVRSRLARAATRPTRLATATRRSDRRGDLGDRTAPGALVVDVARWRRP